MARYILKMGACCTTKQMKPMVKRLALEVSKYKISEPELDKLEEALSLKPVVDVEYNADQGTLKAIQDHNDSMQKNYSGYTQGPSGAFGKT